MEIVHPASLGAPSGYSHGVLAPAAGRLLWVAGQCFPKGGFAGQFEGALARVLAVVEAAGGKPDHLGRLTIYVTDRQAYLDSRKAVGAAYRRLMGKHYPAMALLEVKGLVQEGALVEIEATAVIP